MIKNFFTTSWRFLWKNKSFSLINIAGLTAGTLACLYILLYVYDQKNYDRHHRNGTDLFRVTSFLKLPGDQTNHLATCSAPIAPAMKNDFAEVMQFARTVGTIGVSHHLLRYKENSFFETDAIYVDSTFFELFNYRFLSGDPATALRDPYSIVLNSRTALKLFGTDQPVGAFIEIDNSYGKQNFKVTGVVDESLGKTHIKANLFLAMNSGGMGEYARNNDSWAGNNFTSTYIRLHPEATPDALEKKLPAFLIKYGAQQLKDMGMEKVLHLQPVADIHTSPGYQAEMSEPVNPFMLNVLMLIAILIQGIACVNFMNLSTARSSKRAKEVGVRKVMGAGRAGLIKQFIGESALLSGISVAAAVLLLYLAMPMLNKITQTEIQFFSGNQKYIWLLLAGITLVTALLAGSYPAFYLSAFNAVRVIKGNFTSHISSAGIRKSLVVFQFVLSIILITGILVIYQQMRFIQNKDLGFEKEQRIVLNFRTEEARRQMDAFRNELIGLTGIKGVCKSNNYPSQFVYNDIPVFLQGGGVQDSKDPEFIMVDEHFTEAMGIKVLAGRPFHDHDSGKVLINETLARELGLDPQHAEGTRLFSQVTLADQRPLSFEIAGVIADFNFNSLHRAILPFMLLYGSDPENLTHLIVATSSDDYGQLLSHMESAWLKFLPAVPFDYVFLDDQVQKQYQADLTFSKIIGTFALFAILISCLGLFGLAAFRAEQSTKEIGIRKVLGASVASVFHLLAKDFLILVSISFLIAAPIAWWAMQSWLKAFEYRISVSGWVLAAAGLATLIIALCTISYQALKAAVANPVKSLRTE